MIDVGDFLDLEPIESGRISVIGNEATDIQRPDARLVSTAVIRVTDELQPFGSWTSLVNPRMPIPPQGTTVHGFTDKDVAEAPLFEEIAWHLWSLLEGCTVIGYNLRYDLSLLRSEFLRVGIPPPRPIATVDPYLLFCKDHPRTLDAASKQYLGRRHNKWHNALADATVTADILRVMLESSGSTLQEVQEECFE